MGIRTHTNAKAQFYPCHSNNKYLGMCFCVHTFSIEGEQGPRPEALKEEISHNSVTSPVISDKVHEKVDDQNRGSPARPPNQ